MQCAPLLRVLSELRMPLVTAVAAERAAATMLSCSMLDVDTVATVGQVVVCSRAFQCQDSKVHDMSRRPNRKSQSVGRVG